MKKVYLILTLFVASLFFYSNKVYAATHTYDLPEENIALINEEFFSFRDKVIKYVEANNYKDYIISHNDSRYQAYLFYETDSHPANDVYGTSVLRIEYSRADMVRLDSSQEIKVILPDNVSTLNLLTSYDILNYYLDSNFDLIYSGIYSNIFIINYKDTQYTIKRNSTIPTLYQIYLEHNVPPEPVDPFSEEKEIMNNFYSTIFTKIGDLATSFANNYIFLLIFGIFILIFIFEIIRRRII